MIDIEKVEKLELMMESGEIIPNPNQKKLLWGLLHWTGDSNGWLTKRQIMWQGDFKSQINNVDNYLKPFYEVGLLEKRFKKEIDKRGREQKKGKVQYRLKQEPYAFSLFMELILNSADKYKLRLPTINDFKEYEYFKVMQTDNQVQELLAMYSHHEYSMLMLKQKRILNDLWFNEQKIQSLSILKEIKYVPIKQRFMRVFDMIGEQVNKIIQEERSNNKR